MSVTDPSAEPTQPEGEGQGGEASGGSPWESYLTRFPEDQRDVAAEAFREMEGHATKRFQEHAQYKEAWEPYEQAGVNQVSPEDLQWALQVRQAALEDPQALREWLDQQHGPIAAPEPQVQQQATEDPYGFQDPQQQLEQLLSEKLGPVQDQLQQFSQWREQLEQSAHEARVAEQINHEVAELKAKHAEALPAELRDQFDSLIETFAMKYAEPGSDPKTVVAKAWGDFETLANVIEKASLQAKVDAPAPAEGGGVPDVTPPKVSNIMDAAEQAKEFLRAANRA